MSESIQIPDVCDCLGRTCLKWSADGELTALDFTLVMQRLAQADPEVTDLQSVTSDRETSSVLS